MPLDLCRAGLQFPHVVVLDAVVVGVGVTGVTHPVPVGVLLARVWHEHAVILNSHQDATLHQRSSLWSELLSEPRGRLSPAGSCFRCTRVQCQVFRQCRCPFRTCSHCLPSQRRTITHAHPHTHTQRENGKAGTLAQLVLRLGSGVAAERKLTSAFFPPESLRSRRRCRPSAKRTRRCRDTGWVVR